MKKIKINKLKKINGGTTMEDTFFANCKSCGELFPCNSKNNRMIGKDCDSYIEYQCTKCNAWNKF